MRREFESHALQGVDKLLGGFALRLRARGGLTLDIASSYQCVGLGKLLVWSSEGVMVADKAGRPQGKAVPVAIDYSCSLRGY